MISVIMQILEGDLVTSLVGLGKLLNMTDFLGVVLFQDLLDMQQGHQLQRFELMITTS